MTEFLSLSAPMALILVVGYAIGYASAWERGRSHD